MISSCKQGENDSCIAFQGYWCEEDLRGVDGDEGNLERNSDRQLSVGLMSLFPSLVSQVKREGQFSHSSRSYEKKKYKSCWKHKWRSSEAVAETAWAASVFDANILPCWLLNTAGKCSICTNWSDDNITSGSTVSTHLCKTDPLVQFEQNNSWHLCANLHIKCVILINNSTRSTVNKQALDNNTLKTIQIVL